jgi:hypothetical protein
MPCFQCDKWWEAWRQLASNAIIHDTAKPCKILQIGNADGHINLPNPQKNNKQKAWNISS